MHEMEVIMMVLNQDKERKFYLLGFTGMLKDKNKEISCVALGSDEVAIKMMEEGTLVKKEDLE